MALLLRIRRGQNPLLRRAFSTSSGEGPFPPPSSDPASADQRANLSPFAGIRSRLNSSPPRPGGAVSPPPPPAAPTHDDVRRSLHLFRNPQPSSAAANPTTPSFVDILRRRPTAPPTGADAAAAPSAFAALRESLSKMAPLPVPGATKPLGWGSALSRPPQRQDGKPPLPESIFGREMRGQMGKGHGGKVEEEEEFIRSYSYDELGKRLGELRPAPAAGKDGKEWFSLEELSRRLKRLREMDKEERERAPQSGMGTGVLRDVLVKLKDQKKTSNLAAAQSMSFFMGSGSREATPAYLLRKPQNELVEKYFHPDHMSSAEKMKLELQRVRDEFKMSENDCGSAPVQVAQLTTKIKHLSVTLHKKDKHSRKGLQEMVQRRKKYLKYLRRTDWDSYCLVLSKLGLRDVPEYKPPDYKSKSSTSKTKAKRKSKRKMKA